MSLVADYGTSSSSSASSEAESEDEESIDVPHLLSYYSSTSKVEKLPKPVFDDEGVAISVFKNPFREEENAKTAILEKHVKMVETRQYVEAINGKKICWNYRKGRCRFGHNCKYAHDSDLQKSQEELDKEKEPVSTVVCDSKNLLDKIQTESTNGGKNKKKNNKRPGLSQELIPGKKIMKMYYQTKN